MKLKTNKFSRRRRCTGAATIEFVLSLPPLMALAALILTFGWASLDRASVITDVRHKVWSMRERPTDITPDNLDKQFDRTRPFALGARSGQLTGTSETLAHIHSSWGTPTKTRSGTSILVETWDYTMLSLDEKWPHVSELQQVAAGLGELGELIEEGRKAGWPSGGSSAGGFSGGSFGGSPVALNLTGDAGGTSSSSSPSSSDSPPDIKFDLAAIADIEQFKDKLLGQISDSAVGQAKQQVEMMKQQIIAEIDKLKNKINDLDKKISKLPFDPPLVPLAPVPPLMSFDPSSGRLKTFSLPCQTVSGALDVCRQWLNEAREQVQKISL
jgi:hypothetical protein